jgi:hypothetical protein
MRPPDGFIWAGELREETRHTSARFARFRMGSRKPPQAVNYALRNKSSIAVIALNLKEKVTVNWKEVN